MGDTFYSDFVPFTMGEFERHLYMYCFDVLKPSPTIEVKFKLSSYDPVQGNNFLNEVFCCNDVRRHKDFKCCFT